MHLVTEMKTKQLIESRSISREKEEERERKERALERGGIPNAILISFK